LCPQITNLSLQCLINNSGRKEGRKEGKKKGRKEKEERKIDQAFISSCNHR
jgi:hypothetical protein